MEVLERRKNIFEMLNQGVLAGIDGYGYYEPITDSRATALILRGISNNAIVLDFGNRNGEGVKLQNAEIRRNEYQQIYFKLYAKCKRDIPLKKISVGGITQLVTVKIFKCKVEPVVQKSGWFNPPPEEKQSVKTEKGLCSVPLADLVFIGYEIYQLKKHEVPLSDSVMKWLNDEKYIISLTEGNDPYNYSSYELVERQEELKRRYAKKLIEAVLVMEAEQRIKEQEPTPEQKEEELEYEPEQKEEEPTVKTVKVPQWKKKLFGRIQNMSL